MVVLGIVANHKVQVPRKKMKKRNEDCVGARIWSTETHVTNDQEDRALSQPERARSDTDGSGHDSCTWEKTLGVWSTLAQLAYVGLFSYSKEKNDVHEKSQKILLDFLPIPKRGQHKILTAIHKHSWRIFLSQITTLEPTICNGGPSRKKSICMDRFFQRTAAIEEKHFCKGKCQSFWNLMTGSLRKKQVKTLNPKGVTLEKRTIFSIR